MGLPLVPADARDLAGFFALAPAGSCELIQVMRASHFTVTSLAFLALPLLQDETLIGQGEVAEAAGAVAVDAESDRGVLDFGSLVGGLMFDLHGWFPRFGVFLGPKNAPLICGAVSADAVEQQANHLQLCLR